MIKIYNRCNNKHELSVCCTVNQPKSALIEKSNNSQINDDRKSFLKHEAHHTRCHDAATKKFNFAGNTGVFNKWYTYTRPCFFVYIIYMYYPISVSFFFFYQHSILSTHMILIRNTFIS